MLFYFEKFRQVRKQLKVSMSYLAEKAEMNRATLWTWETGKITPSEKKVRLLANILNISVNAISDLEPQKPISNGKLSELANSWLTLADEDVNKRKKRESIFIEKIKKQFKELDQATIIIKALLASMESVFYVKDTSCQYITANSTFLKNASLNSNYRVFGCSDYDFFPTGEAKKNTEEDEDIIISGKPIINEEGFIPGTRKKRWGIISKVPIYDSNENIAGIVGTFTDITDRKHRDGILDLLESHMKTLGEGVVIRNNKEFIYVNKAIEQIFGYNIKTFIKEGGIKFWLNTCVHPDDRQKQKEMVDKDIRPIERTYRIIKPNGEIRHIKAKITKEKYLGSDYFVSIIRDVTDICPAP